jgi:L-ascorbate metabolism protein UlaG (beta-lactamase superfamily)
MRLTKLGHSCFRVESDGITLVLDPGAFSDPDAISGADAVLITHEHPDHVQPEKVSQAAQANPDLEIWTNPAVAAQLADTDPELRARTHAVTGGDRFTVGPEAGGIDVHVHGDKHAVIHPDLDRIGNVGFLLPGGIFHPGDALTVPDERVTTALAPAAAPWLKLSELVDWLREVGPERAYLMHDAVASEAGLGIVKQMAGQLVPAEINQVANGQPFEV